MSTRWCAMPREPLDLDAIEARATAASAGPWVVDPCQGDSAVIAGGPVALVVPWRRDLSASVDCEFIAHARTDIPALVAAVRERDATIADLRARLSKALAALQNYAYPCSRCLRLATRYCGDCGLHDDSCGCDEANHAACRSCGKAMMESVPHAETIRAADAT